MQPEKTNSSFLYAITLLMLLTVGLALFMQSSFFTIKELEIQGLQGIPEGELRQLTSGIQGENLFLFDSDGLQRKISVHPLVQAVDIERKYPDTIVIRVSERSPAALVVVDNGVLEVDTQGVFLRRLESWPEVDYPVISGIAVPETVGPGQPIESAELSAALKLLQQAPPELPAQIGEIHVNAVQQITLYLTSGVEVRMGWSEDWEDKLAALAALINDPEYQSFEQGIKYIDFTAAKPVLGR